MSKTGGASTDTTSFREHRAGTFSGPGQNLPAGVGVIQKENVGPGRRYLFKVDDQGGYEILAPTSELDRDIEGRLRRSGNTRRTEASEPTAAALPPVKAKRGRTEPDSELEALAQAKARDRQQLIQSALDSADMVKIVIDRRSPQLDMPDIIDDGRGGGTEPDPQGRTWQCFPNHLVTCQEYPEWGPGGPVRRLPKFVVPPMEGDAGRGVVVAVVDTGGRVRDHEMLEHHSTSRGRVDDDIVDMNRDGNRDLVAGHGTFVAAIIRQVAPGAEIVIRSAADASGTAEDGLVAGSLLTLLKRTRVDIVNLSMGGYLHEDEGGGLPLTTDALRKLRAKWPRLVVVAAAGNDAQDDPFYPAALPDVIGVGALDRFGKPATFSNFGPWVDAWALGERLRSAWVGPSLTLPGGGGTGREGASWSGTSFATPMVVGALAAAMRPASNSSRVSG